MSDPGRLNDDVRLSDTSRTETFSDGVFAIIITLLVLDLENPEHEPGKLLSALLHQWPSYLAFAASFVYVGVIWLNHHALFRRIQQMDLGLNWMNLGVLFGTVIIPFPTSVLAGAFTEGSDADDQRVAVCLYAAAAALMSLSWLALFLYLHAHPRFLVRGRPPDWVRSQLPRPLTGMALYTFSALVGWFVSPLAGLISILVMIGYHAVTSEGLHEGPIGRLVRPRKAG